VKCEFGDPVSFESRGWLEVVALTRALGRSGEPDRLSWSAVQHSLEAIVSNARTAKKEDWEAEIW
jgi:hypothetical protein